MFNLVYLDLSYYRDIPCKKDVLRAYYIGYKYGIIKNIADNLFPANLFSSVLLWQNVALNVLFIVVLCIGLGIIALGICGKFNKTIFKQESLNIKALKKPLRN